MDEELNPLAQYDDLEATKSLELASKQVVSGQLSAMLADNSPRVSPETDLRPPSTICEGTVAPIAGLFRLNVLRRMQITIFGRRIECLPRVWHKGHK